MSIHGVMEPLINLEYIQYNTVFFSRFEHTVTYWVTSVVFVKSLEVIKMLH